MWPGLAFDHVGYQKALQEKIHLTKESVSQYIHFNRPLQHMQLFEVQGKSYPVSSFHEQKLDISFLKPGIYYLRVQTAEGIKTQKVVKE